MNILHLSTADYGGAGTAAFRLHQNFVKLDQDSRMVVMDKRSSDPRVYTPIGKYTPYRLKSLVSKASLKVLSDRNYLFQNQLISTAADISGLFGGSDYKPDVIVAHSISNFITVNDLHRLYLHYRVPIVWYLMDMAPLTGGCHYAWDCDGFHRRCGNCPALRLRKSKDLSRKVWAAKYDVFKECDTTVVAGSTRLLKQAQSASVFIGKRIEKIMLAVDPAIFKAREKKGVRQHLNLPLNKKIIFFGAQFPKMKRKGMAHLIEALKIMGGNKAAKDNNILLVTAGKSSELDHMLPDVFPHISLGYISGEAGLAAAYQAADVFVCPSIEDSGPMMINESIMCGTPVVAFKMGVATDLVISGNTGYCAELENVDDLATGIDYVLDLTEEDVRLMSDNCSELGQRLCHPAVQTESFLTLFKSIRT